MKIAKFLLFLPALLAANAFCAEVQVSTATGKKIQYDDQSGVVSVEGDAVVKRSSATLQADEIRVYTKERTGEAKGNVKLNQGTSTVKGTRAEYNWKSSTGVVYQATGVSPPWRFTADRLTQRSENVFDLQSGYITSCNHDPPHYRIRSKKGTVVKGKRITLKHARFLVENMPAIYFPIYTKSLKEKKYVLRIEPGYSGRDGITNRTIFGYPFTENSFTKLRWDYLQETGNGFGAEHQYSSQKAKGNIDTFFVRDDNPDPRPEERRYTILWNHYQQLTKRLSLNAKLDFKSDQQFGNQFSSTGNGIRVENSQRGVLTEAGFTYQLPKASIQLDLDRRDQFDSNVSSDSFISKLTLPRVTFNTIPLKFKYIPAFVSFNGSWVNETLNRSDPETTLRYQRSGSLGTEVKKDFRLTKKITFTPRAGYNQQWKDRDTSTMSEKDVYQGRYNTGADTRVRLNRLVDLTVGHTYVARFKENRTDLDTPANDRGIETNRINVSVRSRVGRSSRVTLRSGYNLLSAPRNLPSQFDHTSERIISPSADLQIQLRKNVSLFFRETYSLFDTSLRRPVRTPANTSGEIQFGSPSSFSFFSQGFSYTKGASGADSVVNFTNKLKFFLTPKWHIDLFLSYRAIGPDNLNYSKIKPIEKTINIVRDLHCWIFRMSFSDRTDRREVNFNIDLKTNFNAEKNIFKKTDDIPFYPYRDDGLNPYEIFPPDTTEIRKLDDIEEAPINSELE